MAKRKRSRSRRSSASGKDRISLMRDGLTGAAYGALRGPLNSVTRMVPMVGSFGDEAALALANFALNRYVKNKHVKRVTKYGFQREIDALTSGLTGNLTNGLLGSSAKLDNTAGPQLLF